MELSTATRVERVYPTGAVLPALEDTAGNRVGRPFEVGTSDTPAVGGGAAPVRLSFRPAGTTTEQSAASATR